MQLGICFSLSCILICSYLPLDRYPAQYLRINLMLPRCKQVRHCPNLLFETDPRRFSLFSVHFQLHGYVSLKVYQTYCPISLKMRP
jgi:hypothetical protein